MYLIIYFLTYADIASSFNQLGNQSWIANAYILTNVAFVPVYGQLADILGRHVAMHSAIFIFLIGSAICTGAQSYGMLLVGRGISGIGGPSVIYPQLTDSGWVYCHDPYYF
jgi:MFS family permease